MKQTEHRPVRTRFAPSPTGYLHIGGARTALYSWLYARQHQGIFILRIEDTDLERSTDDAIKAIIESMEWLGLDYDEGPYFQTKRLTRYHEVLDQLLKAGKAYRCYCSKERLAQLREVQQAQKQKPRYDGQCRDLQHEDCKQPHVIRFRNPQEGAVSFTDLIRGQITVNNSELDDLVIARSDGMPTYNFSVVVDDWDMQITHVIRGDDHINNTPRQLNIFAALDAPQPEYGHVPMILGSDGKRLSKRHGAVSVLQYREEGYLPQALMNYLVRLGWSYQDQEVFSREQMLQYFNPHSIQRAPAAFNPEKLAWLNQHYLKNLDAHTIAHILAHQLEQSGLSLVNGPQVAEVVKVQAERCKTLVEMAQRSRYFFTADIHYDEKACAKFFRAELVPVLNEVREGLHALSNWEQQTIHQLIMGCAERHGLNMGQLAQPIRIAITGGTVSPPIDITLLLLGREQVCQRIEKAITWIQQNNNSDIE